MDQPEFDSTIIPRSHRYKELRRRLRQPADGAAVQPRTNNGSPPPDQRVISALWDKNAPPPMIIIAAQWRRSSTCLATPPQPTLTCSPACSPPWTSLTTLTTSSALPSYCWGMLGNALVIFVSCCGQMLRSPSNLLGDYLAAEDFLISLRQSSVFFVASLHHRWVFGELACELYAFCGALFGISSMMTLTAIAAAAGPARRAESGTGVGGAGGGVAVLTGLESAYVPEGLQTT